MTATVRLTDGQVERLYERLYEKVNALGFGYGRNNGDEYAMLRRFYTPEDAQFFLDMPDDEFFSAEQFAEIEKMSVETAKNVLDDMSRRADIYHEKGPDGADRYHVIPAAHGIYEFHQRWFENDWLIPMRNAMFANPESARQTYGAGFPFYHALPVRAEYVKGEGILPEDDWRALLAQKRRFAVCNCQCYVTSHENFASSDCDCEADVCIQTDAMADYYLDDLKTGREITYEEALAIMERGVERGLVPQTTFSKKNEIFCSCGLCHCGILRLGKWFPGDANANQTRYALAFDPAKCAKCVACVMRCPMEAITLDEDGYPAADASCVGCGQCVSVCEADARWLERKPAAQIHDYAEDMWESYAWMEEHRRNKGALD